MLCVEDNSNYLCVKNQTAVNKRLIYLSDISLNISWKTSTYDSVCKNPKITFSDGFEHTVCTSSTFLLDFSLKN